MYMYVVILKLHIIMVVSYHTLKVPHCCTCMIIPITDSQICKSYVLDLKFTITLNTYKIPIDIGAVA